MTKKYDPLLFLLILILMMIGGVMVYSSSSVVVQTASSVGSSELLNLEGNRFEIQNSLFQKQFIYVFIAIMAIMFALYFDLKKVKLLARISWPVAFILLVTIPFFVLI